MTANPKLLVICGVCFFGPIACSTTVRYAIKDVKSGMSADQVTSILGDPAKRSSRGTYEAFRYETKVLIESDSCSREAGVTRCASSRQCEYVTVWLDNNVVKSVTGRYVSSKKECGLGTDPENWDLMPVM